MFAILNVSTEILSRRRRDAKTEPGTNSQPWPAYPAPSL